MEKFVVYLSQTIARSGFLCIVGTTEKKVTGETKNLLTMSNTQNGKGSKARPLSVSYETYGDNYDNIFRKKKYKETWKTVIANPNFAGKVTIALKEKTRARWKKSADNEEKHMGDSGVYIK